jgi:hypothetical protein
LASPLLTVNKEMVMRHTASSVFQSPLLIAASILILQSPPVLSATRLEAKDIVSIQLRAQGVACTKPINAIKDIVDSSPDEMAWIISCKEATYRVKLIPHVGSKIEVVGNGQSLIDAIDRKE